jgi:hypothetical protein
MTRGSLSLSYALKKVSKVKTPLFNALFCPSLKGRLFIGMDN